jgi:hypothetical protein
MTQVMANVNQHIVADWLWKGVSSASSTLGIAYLWTNVSEFYGNVDEAYQADLMLRMNSNSR